MDENTKRGMIIRSACGLIAQTTFLFSVKLLPITIANILGMIYPFIVAVLSHFILKERLTKIDCVGLIGSFSGVYILIMAKVDREEKDEKNYVVGVIVSFICAFAYAGVTISGRFLKDVHYSVVLFFMSGCTASAFLIWLIFEYLFIQKGQQGFRMFSYPLYPNWPLILGCSVTNTVAFILRTLAI